MSDEHRTASRKCGFSRRPSIRRSFCLRSVLLAAAMHCTALPGLAWGDNGEADKNGIIHAFDFHEPDNLENTPKYWTPVRPYNFPKFAVGRFDPEVGHDEAPSFYLHLDGRNIAYEYTGPSARVRADGDYRVYGYVRPDRLVHARACLTAVFLDARRRPLLNTMVRSRFIGGSDDEDWVFVELILGPPPRNAYSVSLAAWVVQESVWDLEPRPVRYIERIDVDAGAWFDDLSVLVLPRVSLSTSSQVNVIGPGDDSFVSALLVDPQDRDLAGNVEIATNRGDVVVRRQVEVVRENRGSALRIPVTGFKPGMYTARARVTSESKEIAHGELNFAVVADRISGEDAVARSFGVVLDPGRRAAPEDELELLQKLVARSVKIPLWVRDIHSQPSPAPSFSLEDLYLQLARDSFAMTGVLASAPVELLQTNSALGGSLLEVLTEDPALWRDYLAGVVSPNAGVFKWWQVGVDGDALIHEDARLIKAITQLRTVMEPYLSSPLISVPLTTELPPLSGLPVQQITIELNHRLKPELIPDRLRDYALSEYERFSVFLDEPDSQAVRRDARLARWLRRLIFARHAGAHAVYIPAPWQKISHGESPAVEPTEEYILFRNLAAVLAEARGSGELRLLDGVRCLVFRGGGDVVLVLWDERAPREGRLHKVQLGSADVVVDAWGSAHELERDDSGRHLLTLSEMPVFVMGMESWLAGVRQSVQLDPPNIEFGRSGSGHVVRISGADAQSLSGDLWITAPDGWNVAPTRFGFNIPPRRAFEMPLTLRPPPSASAGPLQLQLTLSLDSPQYEMTIPVPVDVGLSEVSVVGIPRLEGPDLILEQRVTNRSDQTLNFRASAAIPQSEKQYRQIIGVQPGTTRSARYRFSGAASRIGQTARLTLQELNDGPRYHSLDLVLP